MAKVMKYNEVTGKMPKDVVDMVEFYVRKVDYLKGKGRTDVAEFTVGRIKGALEAMEWMDYITDDERWALYVYYGISNSADDSTKAIVIER